MKTAAEKLGIVLEMYTNGFLCKCDDYEGYEDENGDIRREIKHRATCEGRIKVLAMLEDGSDVKV